MKKELFSIYLECEFKDILKKEAKEKGLSLNSYIRMILYDRKKNDNTRN